MVIGCNAFLTPGDVEQMRWVPELVFINCCHLGKTLAAKPRKYNQLAANLAVQFVRMGVKAVVAAGWAVDDAAAEAFAESFYTHLLDGETFGNAVCAAREEIWIQYPNVNTWGAYQCYGDPSYRLRVNEQSPSGGQNPFHSPVELVSALQNLVEAIRMESRDTRDDGDTLQAPRHKLTRLIDRIPDNLKDDWLNRGDVADAYGRVWGELGDYTKAIEWLEKALRAETGDFPMRTMEQYANFQVRDASMQWQDLQRTTTQPGSLTEGRQLLIEQIKKALAILDFLCERGATVERLNLLGSAYKRLAQLQEDNNEKRLEALKEMAEKYQEAYELHIDKPNLYSFSNWSLARALTKKDLLKIKDECRQMIEVAQKRDKDEPSFWNSVAQSDLELVILVAQPKTTVKAAKELAEQIISGYQLAYKRGASPREMASVKENLDFIISMSADKAKPLRDALATIRAAV
jgi:tetratricopeptide (TPR) repeat protein